MKARPALVHELRGLLSEDGMGLPQRLAKCRALSGETLEDHQATLTALSPEVFQPLDEEFLALEKRLAYDDEQRARRRLVAVALLLVASCRR